MSKRILTALVVRDDTVLASKVQIKKAGGEFTRKLNKWIINDFEKERISELQRASKRTDVLLLTGKRIQATKEELIKEGAIYSKEDGGFYIDEQNANQFEERR